ncbi:MAG: mismatch-specific DNA-glycosylase [Actinomycetaceae bacterium]|nr:mismatch-specific DNA-glycosylase [Actinomycetaceae bacterium]MDY6083429.1 mismatch-specific DNA-glycosylase [Actinomycetaceae bacterium]
MAYTRHPSPLNGRRPTRSDLESFRNQGFGRDDLMGAAAFNRPTALLIFGINPGLWSAAVNAPFAYPSNRFWPSLFQAGITRQRIDVTRGISDEDEEYLALRGITLTNLVNRATAEARELSRDELVLGGLKAMTLAQLYKPQAVVIVGISAFRTAFGMRKAQLGRQEPADVTASIQALPVSDDVLHQLPSNTIRPVDLNAAAHPSRRRWPEDVQLWALPQPSGLNAHETVDTLAAKWQAVARAINLPLEVPEISDHPDIHS